MKRTASKGRRSALGTATAAILAAAPAGFGFGFGTTTGGIVGRQVARKAGLRAPRGRRGYKSQDAVTAELVQYADNEQDLYRQKIAIIGSLLKHAKRGAFTKAGATKGFMYLADPAAKKYGWEFGTRTNRDWRLNAGFGGFTVADRKAAAAEWADDFAAELAGRGWQAVANEYGLLGSHGLKPDKAPKAAAKKAGSAARKRTAGRRASCGCG